MTGYGLGGPGIESRWGSEVFRTRPDRPWCPPSLLYNGYRVFSASRPAEATRLPPTPSSAEVQESRAIPLLHLWAYVAHRVNFTFTLSLPVSSDFSATLLKRQNRVPELGSVTWSHAASSGSSLGSTVSTAQL